MSALDERTGPGGPAEPAGTATPAGTTGSGQPAAPAGPAGPVETADGYRAGREQPRRGGLVRPRKRRPH
ncbi:hypothetical protein ACFVIN_35145, partial [Streptomyces prasinus]